MQGVIVVVECEHLCMSMRGIRKPGSRTITSAVRGQLRDPATRAEAMSLLLGERSHAQRVYAPSAECPPRAVMGVVNVTPDSFSDGGSWFEPEAADRSRPGARGDGADIVDVGGESTRPGAERPSVSEELRRVLPVIEALADEGVVVSVDTMRAEVAARPSTPGPPSSTTSAGAWRTPTWSRWSPSAAARTSPCTGAGTAPRCRARAVYADVVGEVCAELAARRDAILAAGVAPERLVLDPGLGFAKHAPHNWALLAHLDACVALGQPVLVGASRKTFLGRIGVPEGADPRPPADRDVATAVTSVVCADAGVWGVRVHDVAATRDAFVVLREVAAHR